MSIKSSDFNQDGVKPTSTSADDFIYSDLGMPLLIHPGTNDINPITDLNAIRQSVKNLVLTNFGERPFHPEIGTGITGLLFENADFFTANSIKAETLRVLRRFEPRVEDVVVQVFDDPDRNAFRIDVGYKIVDTPVSDDTSFYLERVR